MLVGTTTSKSIINPPRAQMAHFRHSLHIFSWSTTPGFLWIAQVGPKVLVPPPSNMPNGRNCWAPIVLLLEQERRWTDLSSPGAYFALLEAPRGPH